MFRTQIVWMGGRLTVEPGLELISTSDHVPEPGAVPVANDVTLAAGSAFRAVMLLQTTSFVRQRRP